MIDDINEQPLPQKDQYFRMGTVTALFTNGTAKILFDGEASASEKQYAYLDSYVPKVNDRVLLASVSGTYVILGKVVYNA